MENSETISNSFNRELDAISANTILDPAFRKKKLILWAIRTSISVVLYIIFWKYNWVKWSLVVIVPVSIFSLFIIIGSPYLLKRKIERTKRKIEETDSLIGETQDE